jgi:hypothetical protein
MLTTAKAMVFSIFRICAQIPLFSTLEVCQPERPFAGPAGLTHAGPGSAGCHVPADRRQRTGGLASRSVKPFQVGSETGPTKLKAGYMRPSLLGGAVTVVGLTCP